MRIHRAALAAAAIALTASACLTMSTSINLADDGSGSYEITLDIDKQIISLAALEAGLPADQMCSQMAADALQVDPPDPSAPQVDISHSSQDGGCSITMYSEWTPQQLDQATGFDPNNPLNHLSRNDQGGWTFRLDLAGILGAASQDSGPEPAADAAGLISVNFDVRLPGHAISHNADGIQTDSTGTTFSWAIDASDIAAQQVSYLLAVTGTEDNVPNSDNLPAGDRPSDNALPTIPSTEEPTASGPQPVTSGPDDPSAPSTEQPPADDGTTDAESSDAEDAKIIDAQPSDAAGDSDQEQIVAGPADTAHSRSTMDIMLPVLAICIIALAASLYVTRKKKQKKAS